ncbi:GRP family sugar transporter [Lapidilactobacillus wuchangensis]|uniref:GRP family sugar transporter n=1 Tax=Lapidilactobacillus wuchangensis TaxID=2486001 RepID=UPI000F784FD5|nr:GRP family sugar transporter [Lapidilactobacillus wuchangensis]
MNVIYLLLPALAWGVLPLVISLAGGRPVNQIFGTAVGTVIASVVVVIALRPTINWTTALLAALAGAFWIIGQLGQYTGYQRIGVSKTMPISTGLQLIGTSLIGVVMFGEWPTTLNRVIGVLGVLLLILGVILTSIKTPTGQTVTHKHYGTLIMLIFTTFGYLIYNTIPRALGSSGLAIFLPESIGMLVAVLIYLLSTKQLTVFKERSSWLNVFGGLIFSVAAVSYIVSVHNYGVNTAFIVSQLSVMISTIGGIIFLHERKHGRELLLTIAGLGLIIAGALVTTLA